MLRLSQSLQSAVILFAVAIPLTSPSRGDAQSTSAILAALEQQIDLKEFQQGPNTLKDVLEKLTSRMNMGGRKAVFLVDVEAFKIENPDMPDFYETIVEFPRSAEKMKAANILRWSLDKILTRNATYVVMPEHILVTTKGRVSPASKLKEIVRGAYKGQLAVVLQQLSETLGITIVVDTRVGDKAKTEIAATFVSDTELGGALRVFTEMAELKVLVLDGVILVTTPIHAETIRKEHQAKVEEYEKRRAFMERTSPKAVQIPTWFSGIPFPAPAPMFDLNSWFDPLWPYDPPHWVRDYGGLPKN